VDSVTSDDSFDDEGQYYIEAWYGGYGGYCDDQQAALCIIM
jgi:hypothetical protein